MSATLSILSNPVFSVRSEGGTTVMNLPEVLSTLGQRHRIEFMGIRAHQRHGWHAFLVQLGALVAQRWGDLDLDRPASEWRQALLELVGDAREEAWCLAVSDLSRPAFMQSPVPEGTLDGFKNRIGTPDSLDVLVTAKNHDEKQARITAPRPEHWAYALVTLQTMEGFLGRGNYGIARMNGGFASRPAFGLTPNLDWAERFCRDVGVWLDERGILTSDEYGYRHTDGPALIWLLPWSGGKDESLPLSDLDPFFVEICRRVRLREERDGILALLANTAGPRIDAKLAAGRTGDIWTPVAAEGKALTVGKRGFHYRLLTDLLFGGDYPDRSRAASRPRPEDGRSPYLVAEVLTRGQGKTDGYHQRILRIPAKARSGMERPEQRASLAELAKARVQRVATAQRRVLHPALCALLQSGADHLKLKDERTRPWLDALDQRVDDIFFEWLWKDAEPDVPDHDAIRRWDTRLYELSREQFDRARQGAPVAHATRPKAEARAELMLRALARKHLGGAFAVQTEEKQS